MRDGGPSHAETGGPAARRAFSGQRKNCRMPCLGACRRQAISRTPHRHRHLARHVRPTCSRRGRRHRAFPGGDPLTACASGHRPPPGGGPGERRSGGGPGRGRAPSLREREKERERRPPGARAPPAPARPNLIGPLAKGSNCSPKMGESPWARARSSGGPGAGGGGISGGLGSCSRSSAPLRPPRVAPGPQSARNCSLLPGQSTIIHQLSSADSTVLEGSVTARAPHRSTDRRCGAAGEGRTRGRRPRCP